MADFIGTGTVALFYGHVASNIGDLAINRGEIALLRQAFPSATIRVVLLSARRSAYLSRAKSSFGPEDLVEFVHFRADDKLAPSYVLEPGKFLDDCGAKAADLVVLAAGEHLFHYADHKNYKNLFWRTLPAFAARQRGVRCLIMPSTFGPFESAEATQLIRELFSAGPRVAVREARSLVLLADSVPSAAVTAALDPAFFIPPPTPAPSTGNAPETEKVVGLAMRSEGWGLRLSRTERESATARFEGDGHRESLAFRFGVSLATKVLTSGSRLRVFTQTVADEALSAAIVAEFANTSYDGRIEIVAPTSVEEYLQALVAVDNVVASRFHALVLALVVGRSSFGVYFETHGHKIPGLFDLLERPDLCINLSQADPDTAAEAAISRLAAVGPQPPVQPRLDTLRQKTLDWLTADWDAAFETRAVPTFEHLPPLSHVAIDIMHEAEEKARAQRNRVSEMDKRLKSLDTKVAALRAEHRGSAEKLDAAERLQAETRQAIAEAEERLNAIEAGFQAETARLNHELEAAQALLATKDRDLSVMRTKANRERRWAIERAEQTAKAQAELARRVEELEQSESFRLGYAIVRVATAPRLLLSKLRRPEPKLPAVPGTLRKQSAEQEPAETAVALLTNDELKALYTSGGADAVISAIADRAGPDAEAVGTALVQTSRQMIESGAAQAEYLLVQKAIQVYRSDQTLRAMFWAAQRAGRVREAWNHLHEIEDLYGLDLTPAESRWLTKARSGAIMNLALLDEIVFAPKKAFEPRAGHICYVLHNSLPYSSGGYATRAHGLALGLRTARIEVTCITRPGYPFDVKPELKGTTLPSEHVVDGIRYVHLWEPKRGGSALARYVRGAADAFEAQFRKFRPALVMAASAHLSALPALIAARRLGLPFIYEVRGFWEITRWSRQPDYNTKPYFHVQRVMEAEIASHADHVFTLTSAMRAELVERGVPAEKISLLPNSCDPDRFTPRQRDAALAASLGIPADVPVIGYIGTFVQYEGLEDLAQACALLRARGMVFRLLLVGNEDTSNSGKGRITTDIERIASEQNLTDWLIMPGRVPHEEVEAYYSLIDIAPFPRKPQPVTEMVSPMKPLEALSMEKAVVVSSVGALAEIVCYGEIGLIFEKGNIESMADTLGRLISDPELRARLGRTARTWVARERTWVATAMKARNEIERILSAESAPAPANLPTALSVSAVGNLPPTQASHPDGRDKVFQSVRELYAVRDRARGKVRYHADDWERTRLAFEMLEGARTVVDIGIGQAQLVNLLARCPDIHKVYGFDFRNYTTRIDPPANGRYDFRVWNITRPLKDPPDPVDVVVAMEVLEHIDVAVVPAVFERLRALSSQGAVLITVPYREKEPLYHQGQRHGHKQSFDDAKIEELFGPGCIFSHYKERWYLIFVHDALRQSECLELPVFSERVQRLMHQPEIQLTRLQVSPALR